MPGPEVAKAYVTIIPSLQGAQQTITQELTGASTPAAKKAGTETGSAMLTSMGKTLSSAGTKLTAAVTVPLAGVGVAAFNASSDFETAFAQLTTIADTSSVSVDSLKSGVMDLSSELGISSSEISLAAYSAISAGQDTADALGFVTSAAKLARGGFTDVSTATDVLTTALNAYGLEADQVSHVSDVLIETQNEGKTTVDELAASMGRVIPTAANVNVGLEDLASQYVALTKNGIGTAEATTYINSMLNELGKSGSTAFDMFSEAAGMTFPEYIAAGHSTTEAMAVLADACEDAGLTVSDAFGSAEAGKAANVLVQHAEDATTALDNMGTMAGQTEEAYATMSDTTAVRMEEMKTKLENLAITIGDQLIPILEPFIEKITSGIETLSEKWNSLDDSQKNSIITIAGVAAAIGPLLVVIGKMSTGLGAITGVAGKVSAALGSMGVAIGPLLAIAAVVGVLIAAFTNLWQNNEEFRTKVTAIWDELKGYFEDFGESITETINSLGFDFENISEVISAAWDGLCNFLAPVFETAFQTITDVLGVALNIISGTFAVFSALFQGDWEGAWNAVKDMFVNIWNVIKDDLAAVWETIKSVVSNAVETVKTNLSTAWENVKSKVSEVWETIKSTIKEKIDSAKETVSSVVESIKSKISAGFESAKAKVTSIFTSIHDTIKSKIDAAKTAVQTAIDKIKSIFNFSWSLPTLKLPHLTITGGFSLVPPSVPKFSVSWYARAAEEGALFTTPQIIGVGDAAQPELLIGEERLKELIGGGEQNITINVYGAKGQDENTLADIIAHKLESKLNRRKAVFA